MTAFSSCEQIHIPITGMWTGRQKKVWEEEGGEISAGCGWITVPEAPFRRYMRQDSG
jgi:hypothetical protein